jgi:hypothetical protein
LENDEEEENPGPIKVSSKKTTYCWEFIIREKRIWRTWIRIWRNHYELKNQKTINYWRFKF